MSSVFVIDASLRRTQIKVTPGKYLREVLEEACKTRKLSPEAYTLKTQNNKTLDLSQPFRLSGLSAGAKLQLTQSSKSPGVVSVALQLPEAEGAERLSDKFPSNTSLWLLLRKYEDAVAGGSSSRKLNLTQRGVPSSSSGAGRLMYEQPCLHLLGRNFETFADLQKTLAQLGLNGGSALIRLTFKSTETPLEEAMQEMSRYFSSVDSVPAGLGSSASQGPEGPQIGATRDLQAGSGEAGPSAVVESNTDGMQEVAPEPMVIDAAPAQPAGDEVMTTTTTATAPEPQSEREPSTIPTPASTINGMSVYRPPTSNTPAAALQPEDPTVFEPTIDHAKSYQANLQQAGANKRLLSDKELDEREQERREKLATIQSVVVRVRYPDQSQIETTIYASETAADLYAKVMETLAAAPEPFELRYTGSKIVQETLPNSSSKRLVRDFGFRGKVLVTLVWSPDASMSARQGPSLKEEYRRHATDLKVELASQQAVATEAHQSAMKKIDKKPEEAGKPKQDIEAKMKKFLGFGKK